MIRRLRWSDTSLLPRLAAVVILGFLLLSATLGWLGLRALNASNSRILEERRVLTEMAASQIEAVFQQAFNELLKATTFAPFDPGAVALSEEYHLLAHTYGRIGPMTLGVYFLDTKGAVVLAEPPEAASAEAALLPIWSSFAQPGGRMVSEPFVEPRTGHPAVAVTVAVRGGDGELLSYLSGLIDLSSPAIMGPLERAMDVGSTGHAELVTAQGSVIASTLSGTFLHPGEHATSYQVLLGGLREKVVRSMPYETNGTYTPEKHIMAVVPLSVASWGLALGGNERETLAPVASLRRSLFLSGLVMLAATLALTLWGTRRLVRPVLALTRRARAMEGGDLTTPIGVGEGGEIGALAKAMNEMRQRLLEAQDRLTLWNLELEEKVRQRSQELASLQSRVEIEKLKADFISEVSHELRTPLGLVKGYASTLLRSDVSPDAETRREFLQIILEETERLEELVEDLLDTSRLRRSPFAVVKEDVDLESLLHRVLDKTQTKAQGHLILREWASPLPAVKADARRLEQVFDNLLDNAIKYTPPGKVTIGAQVQDGELHFTVSDEGPGIPAGELGRVFDPFYRGQSAATRMAKGSGLGLTICKGIVEAHGGRIWTESSLGQGAHFHFTIPLSGEADGKPDLDN